MTRLALVLFIFISATIAGCLVVVALVMGQDSIAALLVAAGLGVVLGGIGSWFAARRILEA